MALSQAAYRFGLEQTTEAAHGWHAAQNTAISLNAGTTFLLRFLCQASGGVAHSNIDWTFQYNRNGAGYNDITTVSSVARAVVSVAFANGDNCTNRLTGGTGTFESSAAGCTEDGTSGGTACDIVANGFTETECAIQIVSADITGGDTITFRLLQEGAVLNTYAVTPSMTALKPATVTLDTGAKTLPVGSDVLAPVVVTVDTVAASTSYLLLEVGDALLLQDGTSQLLLQAGASALALAGSDMTPLLAGNVTLDTGAKTLPSGSDLTLVTTIVVGELPIIEAWSDGTFWDDGYGWGVPGDPRGAMAVDGDPQAIQVVPPAIEPDPTALAPLASSDITLSFAIRIDGGGAAVAVLLENGVDALQLQDDTNLLLEGGPAEVALAGSNVLASVVVTLDTGALTLPAGTDLTLSLTAMTLDAAALTLPAGSDVLGSGAIVLDTGALTLPAGDDIVTLAPDTITLETRAIAAAGDDVLGSVAVILDTADIAAIVAGSELTPPLTVTLDTGTPAVAGDDVLGSLVVVADSGAIIAPSGQNIDAVSSVNTAVDDGLILPPVGEDILAALRVVLDTGTILAAGADIVAKLAIAIDSGEVAIVGNGLAGIPLVSLAQHRRRMLVTPGFLMTG